MPVEAWISIGSALLGAVVGGAASLVASVIIDRVRLRREARVRIYDEYMYDAVGDAARWVRLAQDRKIPGVDVNNLDGLAQLRRTAVVAGKRDVEQIKPWQPAYDDLIDLSIDLGRARRRQGGIDPAELEPLFERAEHSGRQVLQGLHSYSEWLEKHLGGSLPSPSYPGREVA